MTDTERPSLRVAFACRTAPPPRPLPQTAPPPRPRRRFSRIGLGVISAAVLTVGGLVLTGDALPAASALPCPDGSQTCGAPQPTFDPGPTQGQTTAPHAPTTTVPGYTPDPPQGDQGAVDTPTFHGGVRPMPTPDNVGPDSCIFNCGPTVTQGPTMTGAPGLTATATQGPTARPTGTQQPTVTQGATVTGAQSSDRNCTPTDPKLRPPTRYSVTPDLSAAAAQAGAIWTSAGSAPITAVDNDDTPTVQIKSIDDPKKPWAGQFERGLHGDPDQITINMAVTTPAEARGVIAHELGHALGLSDSSDEGSLMGFGQGLSGLPQASDIAALEQAGCGPGFSGPQKQIWGACGLTTPESKLVRSYPRASASAGAESFPAGSSPLVCGNRSYGYFHIKSGHMNDWLNTYWNRNWRDSADAGIADTLANPMKVKYQPPSLGKDGQPKGNKWIYCSLLWEKNVMKNGQLTGKTMWSSVVIRNDQDDPRIITAYPSERGLC